MKDETKACDITFAEKVRIYSYDYLKGCMYISSFESPQYIFTKKLYSLLISSSQILEEFLDFHGAKNNKEWYFYRELAATVRHVSVGAHCQKHLFNRLGFYDFQDNTAFIEEGENALNFLTTSLMKIAPLILDEARRLKIPIPKETFDQSHFPGVITSEMLDYDIDDADQDEEKKNIVKIASEYLNIAKSFDHLKFYEPYSEKKILELVPEKINEVEIRQYEMVIHNLQSAFDTYVIYGGFRYGNRKLKQLRGYISAVLHLLKMVGKLLHFYERHLLPRDYKSIYKKTRKQLAEIIDPTALLNYTINYGLYYACHFLAAGTELTQEILNENIERSSITVGIPEKLGFHSRPSLLVAKIVQHYGGEVSLCAGDKKFDASSVLDIQWAGGLIQKENIKKVIFEGDVRSLKDIEILAGVNYGEDSMGKGIPLPKELKYLK